MNKRTNDKMTSPLQIQRLVEPISPRAVNSFMIAFSEGVYLDYLPSIYGNQESPSCLNTSLEAAALAYMANEYKTKDLEEIALRSYGAALSQTNAAVRNLDPAIETNLKTATSVLLLALFAVTLPQLSNEPQKIWSEHVRGALAILATCEPEMFDNLPAQGILHHVISTVQIDCLERRVRIPPQLEALYKLSWLSPGPQAQLWSSIDRLAGLLASHGKVPIFFSYLEEIRDVNSSLEESMKSMPEAYSNCFEFEECTTNTTQLSDGDIIETIPVLKFSSYRMAQRWNTLRILRLLSSNILASATSGYLLIEPEGTDLHDTLEHSLNNQLELAKNITIDICATVPQYLRPNHATRIHKMGIEESAWARSLAWPLNMVKQTLCNSEVLQGYVDRQLQVFENIPSMSNLNIQINSDPISNSFAVNR